MPTKQGNYSILKYMTSYNNLAGTIVLSTHVHVSRYHTMGFVCKVLIFVNYVSCPRLTIFNSTDTFALSFQLTACATVPWL